MSYRISGPDPRYQVGSQFPITHRARQVLPVDRTWGVTEPGAGDGIFAGLGDYGGGIFSGLGEVSSLTLPDVPVGNPVHYETLVATTGQNCSGTTNAKALQYMLQRLGYTIKIIDGTISQGGATSAAMAQFATKSGVPVGGFFPSSAFCQALISAYDAKFNAPAPAACPAGTTGVPPNCVPVGGGTTPPGGQTTPPGGSTTPPGGPPAPGILGWWNSQGTGTKVGIVAGGAAIVVGLFWAMGSKMGQRPAGVHGSYTPPAPRQMTANKRRRARKNARFGTTTAERLMGPPFTAARPAKKKRAHGYAGTSAERMGKWPFEPAKKRRAKSKKNGFTVRFGKGSRQLGLAKVGKLADVAGLLSGSAPVSAYSFREKTGKPRYSKKQFKTWAKKARGKRRAR